MKRTPHKVRARQRRAAHKARETVALAVPVERPRRIRRMSPTALAPALFAASALGSINRRDGWGDIGEEMLVNVLRGHQ